MELDSLSVLTGQAYHPLVVDGVTYKVFPLTLSELGAVEAWGQAQFPDPFAQAELAMKRFGSLAMQKYLLDRAMEIASRPKPRLGSPAMNELLQSLPGLQEMLYHSIRKGDPSVTRETVKGLADRLTLAQIGAVFEASNLSLVSGEPADPKANGPA